MAPLLSPDIEVLHTVERIFTEGAPVMIAGPHIMYLKEIGHLRTSLDTCGGGKNGRKWSLQVSFLRRRGTSSSTKVTTGHLHGS